MRYLPRPALGVGRLALLGSMLTSVAVATLMVTAPAATAAPYERGTFDDSFSSSFDDCGFDVSAEERFVGRYTISKGTPQTGGEFFRVHQQVTYTGRYTNEVTGDFFTQTWKTNFQELPARIVDDNGPVVTYRTHESGVWDVIRDSSGTVRYRSTGNVVFQYLFDTGGDGAPGGGIFLDEEFIRTSGNFETFDADFCDIVNNLIG